MPARLLCNAEGPAPNHSCVHTPQNAAFLSALRNAKRSVFIQTPNLNAEPLLPAMLDACRRGIDVYAYVCLGYNDAVSQGTSCTRRAMLRSTGRAAPVSERYE